MKTWVRKTLSVGVLAAGALLFTSTAAHAGGGVSQDTQDNFGLGNGIQAAAPINIGGNICGNSIAALGLANAQGACGNVFESGPYKQNSKKNYGALNGAQVLLPINGGLNVTGNAISALGAANAAGVSNNQFGGKGKGNKHKESATTEKKGGGNPTQQTSGNYGLLNGLQLYAPVNLGANVCGNSVSVLGLSNAQAACWNFFGDKGKGKGKKESGITQSTWDNYGALNALQIAAPVNALANVTGNAATVGGLANAAGASQNHAEKGKGGGNDGITQDSHGNVGALNGAQIAAPIDLGLNVCGNSLGILGAANAAANCGNDFDGNGGHQGGGNGGNNGGHHGGGNGHGDHDGDNDGDNDGDGDHDGDYDPDGDHDGDYSPDGDADGDYGDEPRTNQAHGKSAEGLTKGLNTNDSSVGGLTGGLLKTLG
ncbi:chaplin family protein [Actinoplanes sp. NBRC 103695]|uniref:chaplin family protein n=1 Tax=Actinoplanes sp. NBRC 103695 TaxID=3032202 RepID=UPI002557891E|nr:chaplin family protein [Actinoplanes sp. NBRC 103695]GLY99197.1 hypothetical protein Acsp02_64510 [Actinoplanes sp. NBRC 103695]